MTAMQENRMEMNIALYRCGAIDTIDTVIAIIERYRERGIYMPLAVVDDIKALRKEVE